MFKEPKTISRAALLCLPLSLIFCFCLATDLNPWAQTWQGNQGESADVFAVFLGDTRQLFANQFFTEADVYFHSGYYPTIFDDQTAFHTPHMALFTGTEDLQKNDREAAKRKPLFVNTVNVNDADGSPGATRNWIDDFSRNFYPVRHTHLSDVGRPGEVAEILPWLKMSLELDPHKIDAYMVASYWLCRPDVNKVAEAQQLVRNGLQANPNSPELLFELGRIQSENYHDAGRARNLWEAGIEKWQKFEAPSSDANKVIYDQLLGNLAKLEEQQGNFARELFILKALERVSPSPDGIREWQQTAWKKLAAQEIIISITPNAEAKP